VAAGRSLERGLYTSVNTERSQRTPENASQVFIFLEHLYIALFHINFHFMYAVVASLPETLSPLAWNLSIAL
jgi:hypothetical protein